MGLYDIMGAECYERLNIKYLIKYVSSGIIILIKIFLYKIFEISLLSNIFVKLKYSRIFYSMQAQVKNFEV